jgi:hypothetical protein
VRIEATPHPGLSHSVKRKTGLSVVKAGKLYLRGYNLFSRSPATGAPNSSR